MLPKAISYTVEIREPKFQHLSGYTQTYVGRLVQMWNKHLPGLNPFSLFSAKFISSIYSLLIVITMYVYILRYVESGKGWNDRNLGVFRDKYRAKSFRHEQVVKEYPNDEDMQNWYERNFFQIELREVL